MTPPAWREYAARTLEREQHTPDPWAYLEDDPTFNRELREAERDLAAGKGTPFREVRR
jgi:hypothetical protein